MSSRSKEIWGFLFLFGLALGVRLYQTCSLTTLTHDGSIAYCAAAGQQNAFSKAFARDSSIYCQWTQAQNWRRFLRIEHPFCFSEIYSGLKQNDIHPPLYFWMLHCWMLIFGLHAWTGPLLNTLIACLSAILLFRLANECFQETGPALAASLIWFASPTVISGSLLARQYSLMTLWGLLLIWRTIVISRSQKPISYSDPILLGGCSAFGLLTHFHYALLIAGCSGYLLFSIRRIGWKSGITAIGSMAAGALLFLLLYGNPQEVFARARLQTQPFDWEQFQFRWERVWNALAFFWGDSRITGILTRLFVLAASGIFLYHLIARLRKSSSTFFLSRSSEFPLYFFFVWTTGITVALYLVFVSPVHAMSSRYLCLSWPFWACVTVSIFRQIPRYTNQVSWAFGVFLIITSTLTDIDRERTNTPDSNPVPTLQKVDALLVDMPARGYLLPVVYQLKGDQWLFIGKQPEILKNQTKLTSQRFHTMAYYNLNTYGNTIALGQKVMDLLQKDYYFMAKGTVWNKGNLLLGTRSRQ